MSDVLWAVSVASGLAIEKMASITPSSATTIGLPRRGAFS
jgi:hypothetical protein